MAFHSRRGNESREWIHEVVNTRLNQEWGFRLCARCKGRISNRLFCSQVPHHCFYLWSKRINPRRSKNRNEVLGFPLWLHELERTSFRLLSYCSRIRDFNPERGIGSGDCGRWDDRIRWQKNYDMYPRGNWKSKRHCARIRRIFQDGRRYIL